MKTVLLLAFAVVVSLTSAARAENTSTQVTPENAGKQERKFTIQARPIQDAKRGEIMRVRVVLQSLVEDPAKKTPVAELYLHDGETFLASCAVAPFIDGNASTFEFDVAAKLAKSSKFVFGHSYGDFGGVHYWFFVRDFVARKEQP